MKNSAIALLAAGSVLLMIVAGLRGCCRQPEVFLELRLTLAKRQWRIGEKPWYLLQIKNVGCKTVWVKDPFWKDQDYLFKNHWEAVDLSEPGGRRVTKQRTYFEVVFPQKSIDVFGKDIECPSSDMWGFHGEFKFWTNDCGGGQQCKVRRIICGPDILEPGKERCRADDNMALEIKPGETLTATPSMVRPVRRGSLFGDPFARDARDLPTYETPKLPPDKLDALRKSWQKTVEDTGLMGDVRHKTDSAKARAALPKGYRILEGYLLWDPGIYRIKAVYEPTNKELVDRGRQMDKPYRDLDWLEGLPKGSKVFRFESNTVEFEVVGSSTSYFPFDIKESMRLPADKRMELLEKHFRVTPGMKKKIKLIKDMEAPAPK